MADAAPLQRIDRTKGVYCVIELHDDGVRKLNSIWVRAEDAVQHMQTDLFGASHEYTIEHWALRVAEEDEEE